MELLEFLALQIADPFTPKGGHRKKQGQFFYILSFCKILANKWSVVGFQVIEFGLKSESRGIKGKGEEGE